MYSKATAKLSTFLSVVVAVLSFLDIVLVVTAPWWLNYIYKNNVSDIKVIFGCNANLSNAIYGLMLAFFIISGILALGILAEGYKILARIRKENPFCIANAISLRNAAICAFALFIVFMAKMFFSSSVLTAVCGGCFLLFGLFILVISQLVRTAAKIKEDNDLTI